ncbi:hypothetical protein DDN22_18145, partial [Vibrio cholerae]|nr:hypothetical protein [Vibrio cholerae]
SVSSPNELRWFRLLWLSLVVMRCQPLRRALCLLRGLYVSFSLYRCEWLNRDSRKSLPLG